MTSNLFPFFALNHTVRLFQSVLAVGLAFTVISAPCASAAVFNVDRVDDEVTAVTCDDTTTNDCSLRGAILAANVLTEASTIKVPAGTYALSQSSTCTYKHQGNPFFFSSSQVPLCVAKNKVTIQGDGAATTVIEGSGVDRVLFVSADATVSISGVTIRKGTLAGLSFGIVGGGGGINNQGTLILTESAVMDNKADRAGGGGIYNTGKLTLLRSTVSRNSQIENAASGGGIFNVSSSSSPLKAILIVSDSTISDNTSGNVKDGGGSGGGIFNFGGAVTVANSTLSGNTIALLGGQGGGIANYGFNVDGILFTGELKVINSTISGNRTDKMGGGIYNDHFTDTHLLNVTITNNTSGHVGGGIANFGMLTLQNTLIAGNSAVNFGSADCYGTAATQSALTSQGHNLIQDVTGCEITGDPTGNITGQNPQLGFLTDNGGLTKTHAPSEGSPAIDAGSPAAPGGGNACAVSDQRGFLRPLGAACDIGAFEHTGTFSLAGIQPNTGGNIGSVSAFVSGNGFASGATVKLTRAGQADIIGNPVQVDAGGSATAVKFDLAGKPTGPWDVVVRNPDGATKTLRGGFVIEQGGAPKLWVDVVGQQLLRSSTDSPFIISRFNIVFGNRGNVDAIGVPLSLSIPQGYVSRRFFMITPPPSQPGQVRDDFSQVPVTVNIRGEESHFIQIPLLLPVIPAGFTGTIQIGLSPPPGAQDSLILTSIGDPVFNPGLDPEVIGEAVAGAQAYLQNEGVTVPPALVPDLEQYFNNQFQQVVERGSAALVASLGTQFQVYSVSQLHLDLALYGAARTAAGVQVSAIGNPALSTNFDHEAVSVSVFGAQTYLQSLGATVSLETVPDLEQYATYQFQQMMASGRATLVASLGTQFQVDSVSQLYLDRALYDAARTEIGTQVLARSDSASEWFHARYRPLAFLGLSAVEHAKQQIGEAMGFLYRSLITLWSWFGPTEAHAQQQNCPVHKKGDVLSGGCSGGGGPNEPFLPPEIPPPPGCNPRDPSTFKNCKVTEDHCNALPGYKVVKGSNGEPFCVPSKPANNCSKLAANPLGSNQGCSIFPLRPKFAVDPNDKVGSLGVTDAKYLLGATPLSYTVFFENLKSATAAAQEVVIIDQLNARTMDLDTFSLGPISFGKSITLIPAPGVQHFTGGVDLRPEQNLIVAITASLDKSTGLLSWRFRSIDPNTGQFTENPDAGFLPPNMSSPEGEGSVVFTVEPKSGLASGATNCNRASIVFDVNAPIDTPEWCNTIDGVAPTSQVSPLAATQSSSTFLVHWSGIDSGSGIADYTIFVSKNGEAYTTFLTDTLATSATFTGVVGNSYAFYSVARDQVGNEENVPATPTPDTTTLIGAPSCAVNVSNQISVTRSGFRRNSATGRYVQQVTLKNVGTAIGRPTSLVLDNLSSNAMLFNKSGNTSCATPAGSYKSVSTGSDNVLSAGEIATVLLEFINPSNQNITYGTRVLVGTPQ